MSSSAAPSSIALPTASITTCAESSAMFVKFEPLKKTWFCEKTPKPTIRRTSTAAIQSAGWRESVDPRRSGGGAGGASRSVSATETASAASIDQLQGGAEHRRHDQRDRRVGGLQVCDHRAVP